MNPRDERMRGEIARTGAYLQIGNWEWTGWAATGVAIVIGAVVGIVGMLFIVALVLGALEGG